jgi:hypothetical protein
MKLELEAASPFARPHLSPWREKHTSAGGHAHSLAFPVHSQLWERDSGMGGDRGVHVTDRWTKGI